MNIAIFASGSGTNAENIISYSRENPESGINVKVVVTNRHNAGVIARAERLGVPVEIVPKEIFLDKNIVLPMLDSYEVNAVILAGFLLHVPQWLIDRYRGRILNIHPSLLPKFGGKGMYGHYVHEAVVAAGEKESGITIHHVTEEYDSGAIIFQAKTPVSPDDTPADVAAKIALLEMANFPRVIAETFGE